MNDATERTTLRGHSAAIRGLVISKNGAFVASIGEDNTLNLWNLRRILNLDLPGYGCDRLRDYLHTNTEIAKGDTESKMISDRNLCNPLEAKPR